MKIYGDVRSGNCYKLKLLCALLGIEHDWVAEEGGYVYEPPGETHTLVVPDDVDEMITYFQVNGVMYYVDPHGKHLGYEDVFTKIDMCRAHFDKVGLGGDYVKNFIR